MVFFTSDLHLGNETVIRIDNRPYSSVDEMDETLVCNWNRKVGKDDIVVIVGDFIHRPKKGWKYYLGRLAGNKILVLGNHDHILFDELTFDEIYNKYFIAVTQYAEIELRKHDTEIIFRREYNMISDIVAPAGTKIMSTKDSRKIAISHYPMLEWNGYYRGFWHIHGHIHALKQEAYEHLIREDRALNAGCQITDYAPATFDELIMYNEIFKGKKNDEYNQ